MNNSLVKEALNKLGEKYIINDEKISDMYDYIDSRINPDNQAYIINILTIIINSSNSIIQRDKFNELIEYLNQ